MTVNDQILDDDVMYRLNEIKWNLKRRQRRFEEIRGLILKINHLKSDLFDRYRWSSVFTDKDILDWIEASSIEHICINSAVRLEIKEDINTLTEDELEKLLKTLQDRWNRLAYLLEIDEYRDEDE